MGLTLLACGHRGPPLPPVYPQPPGISGLAISQRGTYAILRFSSPNPKAYVSNELVEVESIEVLVYAERYPVIGPTLLAAALERQRDLYVRDARIAARAAERATAAEAAENPPVQAAGGGQEAREQSPQERQLSPEEALLRSVPPDTLRQWRELKLTPETILDAARNLNSTVTNLWSRLSLPRAIIDPSRPPELPDPGVVATESEALLATQAHERPIAGRQFLEHASTAFTIPLDEASDFLVGNLLQVTYPLGTPSPGPVRTRYFFAVRAVSKQHRAGQIQNVLAMAPVTVPVAPEVPVATVTKEGVKLTWNPPAGDLAIRELDPATLRYNVYRSERGEIMGPKPMNSAPIAEPSYSDTTMVWGQSYLYEVRALMVPADQGIPRESSGSRTPRIRVIDVFPPATPGIPQTTVAGTQVTVRWQPSADSDLSGYLVYRHPAPAPPLPEPRDRVNEEAGAEAAEPPATETLAQRRRRARRRRRSNPMVEAGWQLLTPTPVRAPRFIDPNLEAGIAYIYAVEAVDKEGNVSPAVASEEPGVSLR
ncbi:MAG: fibronectin type III domain-containing protein [Acidobacteriota bacterium]